MEIFAKSNMPNEARDIAKRWDRCAGTYMYKKYMRGECHIIRAKILYTEKIVEFQRNTMIE